MNRLWPLSTLRAHVSSLHRSTEAAARLISTTSSTINQSEIEFFSRLSSQWWDERGEFALLHRMNPARVGFIRDKILQTRLEDAEGLHTRPILSGNVDEGTFEGLEALDVGCGGGLLAESLARLGAKTTAVDASEENIKIAALHASADPRLASRLHYRHGSAEGLVEEGKQFDVVCSLEVLEHVDNPAGFLSSCAAMVKPGGHLFLSTISRTPLSYFLTIFLAEHTLRLVEPGTHTYSKFVKPFELINFFRRPELGWISEVHDGVPPRKEADIRNIVYDPLKGAWKVLPNGSGIPATICNYLFWVRRPPV